MASFSVPNKPMTLLGWIMLAAVLIIPTWLGHVSSYVAMAAAAGGIVTLTHRRYRDSALQNRGLQAFLGAFLLLAVAFLLSAQAPADLLALFDFAALLLAAPAFLLILHHPLDIKKFAFLCLAGALVAALVAAWDVYVRGLGRAAGMFSSAIFLGNIAVLLGFLSLLGLRLARSPWNVVLCLGPVLGLFAATLSQTRATLIVAAALAAILLAAVFIRAGRRAKLLLAALVGVALVAFLFILPDVVDTRVMSTFDLLDEWTSTGQISDFSALMRLDYYQSGIQAVLDSPIYGHGWWRRFSAAMPYMQDIVIEQGSHPSFAHLHNDLLNFTSAAGVLGAFAYILMLLAPIIGTAPAKSTSGEARMIRLAGFMLSGAYFAMGLTDSMFVFEMPKVVYCLATATLCALASREAGSVKGT